MQLAEPPGPGSFATALQRARTAAGLSQRALALRGGLTGAYISLLESGRRTPDRAAVLKLIAALKLEPAAAAELLNAAGFAPPPGLAPPRGAGPSQSRASGALDLLLSDPTLTPERRAEIEALLLAYAARLVARARAGQPLADAAPSGWQERVIEVVEQYLEQEVAARQDAYLGRVFDL